LEFTLVSGATGRTEVDVRNAGRPGRRSTVTCSRPGATSVYTVNEPLLPSETKDISNAVSPVGTVTCSASGANEDGSPEANTSNSSRTRGL